MKRSVIRIGLAVLTTACVALVLSPDKNGASAAAPKAAPASTPISCSSSTECLAVQNSGTGNAIDASAIRGAGLRGTTKAGDLRGSAGVLGVDESLFPPGGLDTNSGVHGISTWGNGVVGVAKNDGFGVQGINLSHDTSSSNAQGVLGFSTVGSGVEGDSSTNFGVLGDSSHGVGVVGFSPNPNGVPFEALGTSTSPILMEAATNKPAVKMTLDSSGNMVLAGTLTQNGSPSLITRTSAGQQLVTYAARQTQQTVEDFGEARLLRGVVFVPLDRTFASTIDRHEPYLVFLTPQGDSHGLYVSEKSSSGFVVREDQGGRSTLAFDYRIVAKPADSDAVRMPLAPAMASHVIAIPRAPREPEVSTSLSQ